VSPPRGVFVRVNVILHERVCVRVFAFVCVSVSMFNVACLLLGVCLYAGMYAGIYIYISNRVESSS